MAEPSRNGAGSDATMRAIRLRSAGGPEALELERVEIPALGVDDALIRVVAAAITRDELEWPIDRLPATPSYEVSGVVAAIAPGVTDVAVGQAVYALTSFDRDGAAADYVAVEASVLARRPGTLDHIQSAGVPMAGLSAWQGLFDHGHLEEGQRALITGAAGGVGHAATQLARWRGAYVLGTASSESVDRAREFGAHEVVDTATIAHHALEPVDLVFDTVGGDALVQAASVVRDGGRLVTIADEPPADVAATTSVTFFVVEPNAEQLTQLARLADAGIVRPAIDSEYPLAEARAAFERLQGSGKRGKVVLHVADE